MAEEILSFPEDFPPGSLLPQSHWCQPSPTPQARGGQEGTGGSASHPGHPKPQDLATPAPSSRKAPSWRSWEPVRIYVTDMLGLSSAISLFSKLCVFFAFYASLSVLYVFLFCFALGLLGVFFAVKILEVFFKMTFHYIYFW